MKFLNHENNKMHVDTNYPNNCEFKAVLHKGYQAN